MGGTEDDDEEFEYGREYMHTVEGEVDEERQLLALDDKSIWPHWSEGVPTKLCRKVWSPHFTLGKVTHQSRPHYSSIEFSWRKPRLLTELKDNYGLLPSAKYSSEWNGVYRLFVPNTIIDRFCGKDPTGTIYIGRAGSERGWSILRTRLMQLAKREHHVTSGWDFHDTLRQKYPWTSLAVDWAYTEHWVDHKGDEVPGSRRAESWLLSCYNDSFGEYPPLNQEG